MASPCIPLTLRYPFIHEHCDNSRHDFENILEVMRRHGMINKKTVTKTKKICYSSHYQSPCFQACSIEMAMGSLDVNTVSLVPGQIIMSQAIDMAIFQIKNWNLGRATFENGKEGISMTIVMKRKRDDDHLLPFPSSDCNHLCHHLLQTVLL